MAHVEEGVDVSVVIPAYREERTLRLCLESLLDQTFSGSYEVIVVVSADHESDLAYLDQLPVDPRLVIHRQVPRLRTGAARSMAVEYSSGGLIASTDADVLVTREWIAELWEATRDGKCVAGSIVNGTADSAVGTAEYLVEFLDLHPERPARTAWHGAGCNLGIPRELWFRYGPMEGLTEARDVDSSDTVFTLRAAADGAFRFAPRAEITHQNRTSFPEVIRHQFLLGRDVGFAAEASPTYPFRRLVLFLPAAPIVVGARWLSLWFRITTWRIGLFRRAALLSGHLLVLLSAWGLGLASGNRARAQARRRDKHLGSRP
jgi:glycosyltransferase involved in cell wall biosynthesis